MFQTFHVYDATGRKVMSVWSDSYKNALNAAKGRGVLAPMIESERDMISRIQTEQTQIFASFNHDER